MYVTNEISKKTSLLETLHNYYLKVCILYINELVQELLDNTSIFYYDALLKIKKKTTSSNGYLKQCAKIVVTLDVVTPTKWL